jgi:YVTN family beta-propeller protein
MLIYRAGKVALFAATVCLFFTGSASARAQHVIATVPVDQASQIALNPATGYAFVAAGDGVAVIRESTNTLVRTIPTSGGVYAVAANFLTGRLYAANGNALYVIDTNTDTVVSNLPIPVSFLAVNVATNTIYAGDFNQTVYVVNGATNTVTTTITVPEALQMAVNPATNRIYIAAANPIFGEVTVVDGVTNQVITNVTIPGSTNTIFTAVDLVRNLIYAGDSNSTGSPNGVVAVINGATNKVTTTIVVPGEPTGLAVDPVARRVYVDNFDLNEVQIINEATNKLTPTTVPVGSEPYYNALDFYRGLLYVTNTFSETISVISTR